MCLSCVRVCARAFDYAVDDHCVRGLERLCVFISATLYIHMHTYTHAYRAYMYIVVISVDRWCAWYSNGIQNARKRICCESANELSSIFHFLSFFFRARANVHNACLA